MDTDPSRWTDGYCWQVAGRIAVARHGVVKRCRREGRNVDRIMSLALFLPKRFGHHNLPLQKQVENYYAHMLSLRAKCLQV